MGGGLGGFLGLVLPLLLLLSARTPAFLAAVGFTGTTAGAGDFADFASLPLLTLALGVFGREALIMI